MKFIFIFLLTLFISLNLQAKKKEEFGFYQGDPSKNYIIRSGEWYIVLHNPTDTSYNLMQNEAIRYCRETFDNDNYTAKIGQAFGTYTVYFSCDFEYNFFDQYNIQTNDIKCIKYGFAEQENCSLLNEKNVKVFNKYNRLKSLRKKITSDSFIYLVRTDLFKEVEELENKALQNILDRNIQRITDVCENFTFVKGTTEFQQCILKFIDEDTINLFTRTF